MTSAQDDFLDRVYTHAHLGEGPVELIRGTEVLARYETVDAGLDAWLGPPRLWDCQLRALPSPEREADRKKEQEFGEMFASCMRAAQTTMDEMLAEVLERSLGR